jgi:hypothetical protein
MSEPNNIPEWAQQLNPVTPQAPVQVDDSASKSARPAMVMPNATRIEAARAIAIESSRRALNPSSDFNPGYSPAYYQAYFQEWAGKPSCWMACHIYFLAELIKTRIGDKPLPIGGHESYDGGTGTFASLGGFSFDALLEAYHARIVELGISEVALEEWNVEPRGWQASNAFYALSFEQRIEQFRSAKA